MAVDAGDLEEAVEGLVEEGVDDGQRELDVADVPGTVVGGLGRFLDLQGGMGYSNLCHKQKLDHIGSFLKFFSPDFHYLC